MSSTHAKVGQWCDSAAPSKSRLKVLFMARSTAAHTPAVVRLQAWMRRRRKHTSQIWCARLPSSGMFRFIHRSAVTCLADSSVMRLDAALAGDSADGHRCVRAAPRAGPAGQRTRRVPGPPRALATASAAEAARKFHGGRLRSNEDEGSALCHSCAFCTSCPLPLRSNLLSMRRMGWLWV